jgi:hypothetical protein
MKMKKVFSVALCCLLLPLHSMKSSAAESQPTKGDESRPELVSCEIGSVSFRIDGPKLWTLSGFEYKTHPIATADSAYGTVLNIDGVGLLGSAHFLDVPGQPGKVEKENVTELQFLVDGNPLKAELSQKKIVGQSFRMKRISSIRTVLLESEVLVQNETLIESVRLRAGEETRLKLAYPLMYAWSPHMTDYVFGDDHGVVKRGQFLAPAEKVGEGLERTARWMAVYDAEAETGAVCLLRRWPESEEVWFQYTDAPGVYRKLRLMSFSEKSMPARFDGVYESAIGFFASEKSTWEDTAVARLRELRELPPVRP